MSVQQTSIDAYRELYDLGQKQADVLWALERLVTACNMDISYYLGIPINTVTPRVKELRDMELVEEDHRAPNPITGKVVIYWRVVAP
jgi:DNA-binding MarR family transcriptional regulator